MASQTVVRATPDHAVPGKPPPADRCVMVIFGASGDLTKRLLVPALFNLACDGLLSEHFAVAGMAMDDWTADVFRERMSAAIRQFNTRPNFDTNVWQDFVRRLYYTPGNFGDQAAFKRLGDLVAKLDSEYATQGNILFYMATPPSVFGLISDQLDRAGFKEQFKGWKRIIIEKPFGHDLKSAEELNREVLAHWSEDQVYRIDHYLGKETVQNLLVFRFSNGIFEPIWNKDHIDHIQFTVSETVGVEGRGAYYDKAGVLRDMIQNHMLQMLAYVCMEPPVSFSADAIRNEKAKLLEAVRILNPDEVPGHAVRGQYGPGVMPDGTPVVGYRQEPGVDPNSNTETYAALKLYMDNWRWDGVPVYLRCGKRLWKRGTEIVVQFKKAPDVLFRNTPARESLEANKLVFHIQPDQGIEFRFHAKTPGPFTALQKVEMRFDYRESFEAARGTGYEVLLYNCMIGDQTLFSRSDLVAMAWRIVQPILDCWTATPPTDFPNYAAGSWGPKAAFDFIERDGRKWIEVLNRTALEQVSIFKDGDPVFLHNLAMMLKPVVYAPGEVIIHEGEIGHQMYAICRGQVEVLDKAGKRISLLREGAFFGEMSLLMSQPRNATVRALTVCDLFVLEQRDVAAVLKEFPQFAASLRAVAQSRS